MTSSHSPESMRPPDLIQGSMGPSVRPFIKPASFSPLPPPGPRPPPPAAYTAPPRPAAPAVSSFRIVPPLHCGAGRPGGLAKRKPGREACSSAAGMEGVESGPARKVHLSEELVGRAMADLHISHPRPKVARRTVSTDVSDAMSQASLEGLEDRFHASAAIHEELPLPPQRSRKVPARSRQPTLRLSIHQELKSMRTTAAILPESIMARYRPAARTASTAVVLWRPPPPHGSLLPDLVSSSLLRTAPGCGRHRTRCYSEVTSTPYSSHENLNCSDSDMPDLASCEAPLPPLPCTSPTATAEAPELGYGEAAEVPPGVNLQRRNSAPEMSEPTQFVDDGSMEL